MTKKVSELVPNSTQEVYFKYKKTVNMSYTELFEWSKTKCSKEASMSREPIMNNLRLLRKPLSKWNKRDVKDANISISFISRMKKVKRGDIVCLNYSKRDIALKNWAYNPFKGDNTRKK